MRNTATIARELFASVAAYTGPPPLARMLEAMDDAHRRGDLRDQTQPKKRGGARPGAGRRKGSNGKATLLREAIARGLVVEGLQPLDLMLAAMREAYALGDLKTAFHYAADCAPYFHAKVHSTTATVTVRRAEQMTTDELEAELLELGVAVTVASRLVADDTMH